MGEGENLILIGIQMCNIEPEARQAGRYGKVFLRLIQGRDKPCPYDANWYEDAANVSCAIGEQFYWYRSFGVSSYYAHV